MRLGSGGLVTRANGHTSPVVCMGSYMGGWPISCWVLKKCHPKVQWSERPKFQESNGPRPKGFEVVTKVP